MKSLALLLLVVATWISCANAQSLYISVFGNRYCTQTQNDVPTFLHYLNNTDGKCVPQKTLIVGQPGYYALLMTGATINTFKFNCGNNTCLNCEINGPIPWNTCVAGGSSELQFSVLVTNTSQPCFGTAGPAPANEVIQITYNSATDCTVHDTFSFVSMQNLGPIDSTCHLNPFTNSSYQLTKRTNPTVVDIIAECEANICDMCGLIYPNTNLSMNCYPNSTQRGVHYKFYLGQNLPVCAPNIAPPAPKPSKKSSGATAGEVTGGIIGGLVGAIIVVFLIIRYSRGNQLGQQYKPV